LTINYDSICTYDTTITITHEGGYGCIVPEPTFTPNYDGINDDFAPAQAFYENVELFIYNRWGTMLYNQKSVNPKWDGTDLNGNLVPSADYYYIIKFNNTLFNDLTGIITLLK
jgi:gliding motility-associated-like protein